jgi:hypothetical protein
MGGIEACAPIWHWACREDASVEIPLRHAACGAGSNPTLSAIMARKEKHETKGLLWIIDPTAITASTTKKQLIDGLTTHA